MKTTNVAPINDRNAETARLIRKFLNSGPSRLGFHADGEIAEGAALERAAPANYLVLVVGPYRAGTMFCVSQVQLLPSLAHDSIAFGL